MSAAAADFSLELAEEFYSHDKLLFILGLEMICAVVWGEKKTQTKPN